MGLLLNTLSPAILYEEMAESTYFVDKTAFIGQMLQRIGTNGKYVCITRPRRFGKTVMANMLGAFLTKSAATKKLFAQLNIGRDAEAMQHINQYNVIYIDFSRISSNDYQSYIDNIAEALKNDLHKAYPDVDYRAAGGVAGIWKELLQRRAKGLFSFLTNGMQSFMLPLFPKMTEKNTCCS